jgi:peptidoglycan/LPS O-acetylase OafA/YrhL
MPDIAPAPTRPSSKAVPNLPSLSGLRFIAALQVFAFHAYVGQWFRSHSADQRYFAMLGTGGMAVSFFFVLSGFVLTWSARPTDTAPKFWRRRFVRIAPNYVVAWVLALILLLLTTGAPSISQSVPNLFLVQSWVPRSKVFFSMDWPSWSLSCEIFFYLCFPVLLRIANKLRANVLWPLAITVMALVWLVPVVGQRLSTGGGHPLQGIPPYQFWFVYVFPPVRMLDFVLGILLARIVMTGKWIPISLPVALAATVAGYVAQVYVPTLYGFAAATIVSMALLIPAAATADLEGRWSPLRGNTMVRLGELTYAFYLLHQLVLRYAGWLLGTGTKYATPVAIALILGLLVVTVAASWLLYTLVEEPFMRRFSKARRPRVDVTAEPVPTQAPA